LDCYECIEIKKELGGRVDCIKCGRIELMPENYLLVGLIEKYSGILLDGDGAMQPDGIKMVLELEDLENEYVDLIHAYCVHAKMTQRSKANG